MPEVFNTNATSSGSAKRTFVAVREDEQRNVKVPAGPADDGESTIVEIESARAIARSAGDASCAITIAPTRMRSHRSRSVSQPALGSSGTQVAQLITESSATAISGPLFKTSATRLR